MVLLWYFLILLYQIVISDSAVSQCSISNCDHDFCIGNNCTNCVEGYYLYSSVKCELCYIHCHSCGGDICYRCANNSCHECMYENCPSGCGLESNGHCPSCPDGYYLGDGNRCYRCSHKQCKCSTDSGCTGCLPGKFNTSVHCQESCPSDCIECTRQAACSKCVAGKYGVSCQHDCTTECEDGTCDKTNGNCLAGCSSHQYHYSPSECRDCQPRCSTCLGFNNCTSCVHSYRWGNACHYDCIRCTGDCKIDIGCSSGCEDKYYQTFNSEKNGYECIRCNDACKACKNATECITCEPGHWDSYCQYNCTGCSTECNKENGCSDGCISGHYQSRIQNGYLCVECSNKCTICSNATTCVGCETGYYPDDGTNCVRCSNMCQTGACSPRDGDCTGGCIDGWSGQRCNEICPVNCQQCEQLNASSCNSCQIGFYGDSCQSNCSSHCKQENGHETCQKNGGNCIRGCEDGFWDSTCSEQCESGCKGSVCNTTTGGCLDGCNVAYYGIHCENTCSSNCMMAAESSRQCNKSNGSCEMGCKSGWFGNNCSTKCSAACKNNTCFQDNGTCVIDYDDDSSTFSTSAASTERPVSSLSSKGDSDIAVTVGAGAGAAVVVIVVVVVVVLLLRRRRAIGKRRQQDGSISLENVNGTLGTDEKAYATIIDSKIKESSDISPGTVILSEESSVKMPNAPTTMFVNTGIVDHSDQRDTLKMMSNTDILANRSPEFKSEPLFPVDKEELNSLKAESSTVQFEKDNTDDDPVLNEEPEEKETKDGIDENDKTYYNTTGKRVLVSRLAAYVKSKDCSEIVEEFHKLPRGLQKDYNAAKNPRNATKNRYKDIYPYDESRVILNDGGDDYVNASFIGGYNGPKEYIGSSGPFKRDKSNIETVSDFWRMVWQEKCVTIVMLTNCYENTEYKCEQYWPELGNSIEYAKLNVTCVTEDQYADFTFRSFVVTKDGKTLNIRHLHFTAWPDKGVPADVTSMIEYRQKVRSVHKEITCPMIVHCSAGIGRTGTFVALDLLTLMGKAQGYVDIFGCVANLRPQRVNLIQTPEQYEFLHRAILHALTFDCQSITAEKFIEIYSRLIKKKDGKSHIEAQFLKLQSTLDDMSADDKFAVGRNGTLTNKNRGGADIPGDDNRVRLYENRKPSDSDYINAVYINGFRNRNRFIVAQTPLPTTVVDFLNLIFQVKCSCVIMMEEPDLQDQTVGVFWPADNQVINHGVFKVRCKESKTTQTYTLKKLSLMRHRGKTNEEQEVDLYIFTNWPRGAAVPKSFDSLVQLVKEVDTKKHNLDEEIPILIHCMTGAERSCLYCAVSVLIEKIEIEHEVSVVNTLRQIKARRRSAIPTLEQYKFCHQAVISYLQNFDIYSNFGLKSNESTESASK